MTREGKEGVQDEGERRERNGRGLATRIGRKDEETRGRKRKRKEWKRRG